jgi:hypothetical protein
LCPLDNLTKFLRIFDDGYYAHDAAALWAQERIYLEYFLENARPSLSPEPSPCVGWYKLFFALVEAFFGGFPAHRVRFVVVLYLFQAHGTANHILAKSLLVGLGKQPRFAFGHFWKFD